MLDSAAGLNPGLKNMSSLWSSSKVAIMRGVVATQKPALPKEPLEGAVPPRSAHIGKRPFFRHNHWVHADVWHMESLRAGNRITGPAIIESPATTFVVPDGFETDIDAHRLFHLRRV